MIYLYDKYSAVEKLIFIKNFLNWLHLYVIMFNEMAEHNFFLYSVVKHQNINNEKPLHSS